jgi:hypothetical protein
VKDVLPPVNVEAEDRCSIVMNPGACCHLPAAHFRYLPGLVSNSAVEPHDAAAVSDEEFAGAVAIEVERQETGVVVIESVAVYFDWLDNVYA